ncbi:MAG: bifunctional DedA family/phosphatase PAP2 family protein [Patescibacteria group bacterium]|nr:bifunctional DedA family/phosphatase PAP2 family protein [Patescibacteria group bacterium]MDE1940749.1 bifunctional DedA family/phosphatase PAP2 family protein [Patescibacteria group bacterium]MDE1966728.1 bifunctional DedA family/phosphatase PAP2 family protein [Patescibacteria group bacterium]
MPLGHQFSVIAVHLQAILIHGGYGVLFLITMLEGVPVLGMAVPGHVAIIAAGFLARIGDMDLGVVILLSIAGAISGDFIGFMLGRRYGLSFIDKIRPYFFVTDAHIERANALLSKHTGKALIIGRFTPATRALMPFLVGSSDIPAGRFWIFNIIGGTSWAVISILVGYAFGAGYHIAAAYFGRLIVLAVILAIAIIWGYRFVNANYHIFKRYELFTLLINLAALFFLALTIQDAFALKPFMAQFDIAVNLFSAAHVGPALARIGEAVSAIGGPAVTGGIGAAFGLWLAFRKKWRSSAIALLSIASTGAAVGVLKEFFMRARPLDHLVPIARGDWSFPSGHSALSAAFFVMIAYLLAPKIRSWARREWFIVLCVLATAMIGLSRLVLNVHWASDVIAGWSLGAFCATSAILFVRYVGNLLVRKTIR